MRGMNAIRHIRTQVFKLTQSEFALVANVKQSTVSRWEAGVAPTLNEMQTIRDAARQKGVAWDDAWFFDVPAQPERVAS
jgi:transcriptional regulator with XRE-family HTH domain